MSVLSEKETPSDTAPAARRSRAGSVDLANRYGLLVVWAAVIVFFGVLRPDSFLTWSNFAAMFGSQAALVVLSSGLLIALRCGDYDMSIGGVMTLSAMTVAVLNAQHGVNIWVCVALAAAIGVTVGLVNGFVSVFFDINPFIVTLGTGTVYTGLALWLSDSQTISGVSTDLVNVVIGTRWLGVPLAFYFGLGACLIVLYLFERTSLGKRMLFVGKSRTVAHLSGIRVDRVRVIGFALSALFAALAGVVYVGTLGGADPTSGSSYLMPAFAAAFLGSAAIKPGLFNPIGALIAVYFLVTGISGLSILGFASFVQDLFYGSALVLAVALSRLVAKRRARVAAARA
ncbi:ribose ABC transporter permease [Mycobacterium sp. MS1601]|uniref:ABC transporter permease n=1 Tax=Mycobacterium sp. MS1601 TaxID=1936029 RepID=UPI0009790D32|nr:ABC transporter permease [Mycobacterium sp. MS1601]AQA06452.1 ribose ABC transporter permease [Mycobacterium sp. MS1601]